MAFAVNKKTGEVIETANDNELEELLVAFNEDGTIDEWDVRESIEQPADQPSEVVPEEIKTNPESREEQYGTLGKLFPNTADAYMREGKAGFKEGFEDVFSLPGRLAASVSERLYNGDGEWTGTMGRTNRESNGLIEGVVRNPYMAFGALTAPIIGADMAAMGFGKGALALGQGLYGGVMSAAESVADGNDDVSTLIRDAGLGFVGGAGGEALSNLGKYLLKRYSMSQARRILEGMDFGNVNGAREKTSEEVLQFLADPKGKELFDEVTKSVGHVGRRTTKLEDNVKRYEKAFLDNAGNRNSQRLDPKVQDAEIVGSTKASNAVSPDAGSTPLEENLIETARLNPWDDNAWAARELAVNDPKRVPFKPWTIDKGSIQGGGVQNSGVVGTTKSNKVSIGNVYPEEGKFLDRLAEIFDRASKEASGSYGDINIRGNRYPRSPGGVRSYLFDTYFTPLQDAAFGAKGITKEKLLDVMAFAAKQNDTMVMESILQAGKELGFSQRQIAEMLDAAVRIGKEGKLIELIKSGKDMSKYAGNLPININLVNAKILNPMAGISRFSRPATSLTESFDTPKGTLNYLERGGRTLLNSGLAKGVSTYDDEGRK